MKVFITLTIILCNQYFSYEWYQYVKSVGLDNLLTHMVFFTLIELATIRLIIRFPVQSLTNYLQIILYFSVLTHAVGGFLWAVDNEPALGIYDNLKTMIFYLELMGFMVYGITRPNSGRRRMVIPARMAGSRKLSRNIVDNQNNQEFF